MSAKFYIWFLVLSWQFGHTSCKLVKHADRKPAFLKVAKIIHDQHKKNYTMPPLGTKYYYKVMEAIQQKFPMEVISVDQMAIIESYDIITGFSFVTIIIDGVEYHFSYQEDRITKEENTYFPNNVVQDLKVGILSCDTKCVPTLYQDTKVYIGAYLKTEDSETVHTIQCFWDKIILK